MSDDLDAATLALNTAVAAYRTCPCEPCRTAVVAAAIVVADLFLAEQTVEAMRREEP